MTDLSGRRIIITGAASGIGAVTDETLEAERVDLRAGEPDCLCSAAEGLEVVGWPVKTLVRGEVVAEEIAQ